MKPKTKTVTLDPDLQAALRAVCDVALRANGLASFPEVRKLVEAVTSAPEPAEEEKPEG